ncbi:MAG: hypothetical protein J0H43_06920, partial [Actinobacteria bacterium]|nr:hypothetical protein [Actinomycetota bacterium]
LRTAARDSALIAVLGRLDPISLRTLADIHPRGRSAPAIALLLDVDGWADPAPEPTPATVTRPPAPIIGQAEVLRNSGWRIVVVRTGEPIAQVWHLLLTRSGAPRTAMLR